MIRVARGGFLDRTTAAVGRISAELARAEEQALTGLRMNRPSDAPGSVREAERLHAATADQEVWQANASAATGVLDTMEGALAAAGNVIIRARELAVAGASETLSTEGRAAIAIEVESLADSLRAAMNTDYNGRYVFGGTAWGTPPFDATDTYVGNSDLPETRVGTDRWVQTGLDGSSVFQGSVDILGTLGTLSAALTADDAAAVAATLTDLDASTRAISDARAEVGTYVNAVEDAAAVAQSLGEVLSGRLTELISADPAEAYTRLVELRASYQATLQVAGSATNRTLFDFLS